MPEIKQIQMGTVTYEVVDEYARTRLNNLTNTWSISNAATLVSSASYLNPVTGVTKTGAQLAASYTIKNSAFTSTNASISIKNYDTSAYDVVALIIQMSGSVAGFITGNELKSGDTIYVIEENVPDRWISKSDDGTERTIDGYAIDSKPQTGSFAKKTEAAKAGTYTSTTPSTNQTSSAGAATVTSSSAGSGTAIGTATITYNKANANTGLCSTITATGTAAISYDKATSTGNGGGATLSMTGSASGTISATGSVQIPTVSTTATVIVTGVSSKTKTVAAHSHTVNLTKSTATFSKISSFSGGSFTSGTFNQGALPSLTTSSETVVTGVAANGTAVVLTGVKANGTNNFVTGINASTANVSIATTGATIASITNEVLTLSNASFLNSASCSQSFVSGATLSTASAVTAVAADGTAEIIGSNGLVANNYNYVGGWDAGSLPTHGADAFTAATIAYTDATITYATAATLATAGGFSIAGSDLFNAATTSLQYVKSLGSTSADVAVSGSANLSVTGSIAVPSHTHAITTSTATGSGSATITVAAHSHSIGTTATTVTGTASVAVSNHTHTVTIANHTHTLSAHTHDFTLAAIA